MELAGGTIGFMAAGIVILASLWYLRMEIRDLRRELGGLRQDRHRGIGGLRQDMHRELGGLRRDMRRELGGLRQDMRAVRDGLSRVESMLAGARLTRRF